MAMTEQQLRERLRKIAALFSGAKTEGEREAAAAAMARVKTSLDSLSPSGPPPPLFSDPTYTGFTGYTEPLIEMQFSLGDPWHRRLFSALCRRYGLSPFRYRRQRRTTLMLRVKKSFLDRILWPEYCALREALNEYLLEATERIIREEVFADASEAQERSG